NAFDAAVAIAAALAVVEPYSSGFGGGGYFLLHRAVDGFEVMIDARETAPAQASAGMYLDAAGEPIPGASLNGARSAAIPGLAAGLAHLAQHYGRLALADNLAAAIRLAREGFPVDGRYARLAQMRERTLVAAGGARVFFDGGKPPRPGFVLKQPQLAATIAAFAARGAAGFYSGAVAGALVDSVRAAGGIWGPADLAGYRVIERAPIKFTYHGARITSAPPSSAGGVTLAQALNILERFPLGDARAPAGAQLVVEALRRAFQDRNARLGDTDFVAVPVARLIDKEYARRRAATIDPGRATSSESLGPPLELTQGNDTTHFSVIDAAGNRVAATLSINYSFGAGFVAGSTGVLLNDEMDDFSVRPGVPNAYQLKSDVANAIAPGKRPLSSMTPTFVEDERGVLVLGAPGGSRIISQVLLAVLDYLQHPEVDLAKLVSAPRYHHQYWPDVVEVEPSGFDSGWIEALQAHGYTVRKGARLWGNMQAVFQPRGGGAAQAASDPRGRIGPVY
ncbi:MAG TPA: gamma-glutamyltransferase, partial [Burkholderiales bacterium]|nr:gamma-glutamyltransferase [Burkholderiales bacterium]